MCIPRCSHGHIAACNLSGYGWSLVSAALGFYPLDIRKWWDAKLIIDTDPGQDDAVAILLALASPEFDLLGITTVAGNVPLDLTTINARKSATLPVGLIAGYLPARTGRWRVRWSLAEHVRPHRP